MDEIDDLLRVEAAREERRERAVVGLDLPVCRRIPRLRLDPVRAELGEPLAEGVRVEDRRAVEVHAERQAPALGGDAEDADRGAEVRRRRDHDRQDGAGGVVEDREDVEGHALARDEAGLDRSLGVAVPDLVGCAGDEAAAAARAGAAPLELRVGRIGSDAALEGRAREAGLALADLGLRGEERDQERVGQPLVARQVVDRLADDRGRQRRPGLATVAPPGRSEAVEAALLVGADPAVERGHRRPARLPLPRGPLDRSPGDPGHDLGPHLPAEVPERLEDQLVAPARDGLGGESHGPQDRKS